MKNWGVRILSAFLTFALGLYAANLMRFQPAPAAKVQLVETVANLQATLAPLQIEEDTQPTDEIEEIMQPHPVSISPYEIKRLIDEDQLPSCERGGYSGFIGFEHIWEKLNLKIKDGNDPFPERCGSPAKATIDTIEFDGQPGNETLLKLDFGMPESTLYLIFKHGNKRSKAEWELLGYLPYRYGAPFIAPSHRVVTIGNQDWLAIGYIGGHGAGYGLSFEDWYELTESGVMRVLTYQTGLFSCCANPGITSRTKVLRVNSKDGVATVVLQFSNSFEIYPSNKRFPLWTTRRKVTYIKRKGWSEFVIDPFNSEISEEELDALSRFDLEDDYLKGILKYNYRELANVAAGRNPERKEWLRDFLAPRDESTEKRSLLKILRGAQSYE